MPKGPLQIRQMKQKILKYKKHDRKQGTNLNELYKKNTNIGLKRLWIKKFALKNIYIKTPLVKFKKHYLIFSLHVNNKKN